MIAGNVLSVCGKDLKTKLIETKTSLHELKTKLGSLKGSLKKLNQKLQEPSMIQFSKEKLVDYAETQGFGYKTANLHELYKISGIINAKMVSIGDQFGITPYPVEVPIFNGISSQNIKAFLEKNGVDVPADWASIKNSNKTAIAASLKDKSLPLLFLQQLESLESKILKAFEQEAKKAPGNYSFDKAFTAKGIDALIKIINSSASKLMVRSTGKEDTDELANAGGNASVVNVSPNPADILRAMGKVAASYVSEKSFTQRIGAGDQTIFDEPLTPVLMQLMIGEVALNAGQNPKFVEQIPSCGVMFTEEPDGGLSQNDITKTSGITKIDASYGLNEGVVNSIVAVDTFYMDRLDSVHLVIRPKTFRLAPSKLADKKIEEKPNANNMVNRSSLSDQALFTLKLIAENLEAYYKKPMDVEFIVDNQRKIIYLVQARPIVHNPNLAKPSYLKNPKTITDKISCSTIVSAGGGLRLITKKNQVIAKDGIKDALDAYLKLQSDQKEQISCVIVGENAPSTSHEATQFRTEAKPVVYANNLNAMYDFIDQETHFVIDVQQGFIGSWDGIETTVAELITNNVADNGWIAYPIPELVSLMPGDDELTEDEFGKILELLELTKAHKTQYEGFENKAIVLNQSFVRNAQQYLYDAQNATKTKESLAVLFIALSRLIKQYNESPVATVEQKELLRVLQNHILKNIRAVIKTLPEAGQPDTGLLQLKRRYALRFLQALIFQQPGNEIVNGYSLVSTILREIGPEQAALQAMKLADAATPNQVAVLYQTYITPLALTNDVAIGWQNFVKGINDTTMSKEQRAKFTSMIYQLAQSNVLPAWLHTSFKNVMNKTPLLIMQETLAEFDSMQAFCTELFAQQETIGTISPAAFSDPKTFTEPWNKLQIVTTYFTDQKFKNAFKPAPSLAKIIALSVMNKLVETFDLSMKALKSWDLKTGNNVDTSKLKALLTLWKTILINYINLLEYWVTLDDEINTTFQKFDGFAQMQTKDQSPLLIIKKVRAILNAINVSIITISDLQQLNNSPGFDVSAARIGNSTEFKHQPQTLEDIFTFIHQSLLDILSFLFNKTDVSKITPPELCKAVREYVEAFHTLIKTVTFTYTTFRYKNTIHIEIPNIKTDMKPIGMDLGANSLSYQYNYPLRSHSATFGITYTKNYTGQECAITCSLFGHNEYARWEKIADLGALLCANLGFTYSSKVHARSVEFTFIVDNKTIKEKLQTIQYIAYALIAMSYSIGNGDDDSRLPSSIEKVIYETTISPKTTTSPLPEALFMTSDKFADTVFNYSLTKSRVHSAILLAIQKMPPGSDECAKKVIDILIMLSKKNSSYALNSDFLWFKKNFTASAGPKTELIGVEFESHPDFYLIGPELFGTNSDTPLFVTYKQDGKDPFKVQEKIDRYKGKLLNELLQAFIDKTKNHLSQESLDKLEAILPKGDPHLAELQKISMASEQANKAVQQNKIPDDLLPELNKIYEFTATNPIPLTDAIIKIIQSDMACMLLIPTHLDLAQKLGNFTKKLIDAGKITHEILYDLKNGPLHVRQKLFLSYLLYITNYNNPNFLIWSIPAILSRLTSNTPNDYTAISLMCVDLLCQQIQNGVYSGHKILQDIDSVCSIIIGQRHSPANGYEQHYKILFTLSTNPAQVMLQAIATDRSNQLLKADDATYIGAASKILAAVKNAK